MPETERIIIRFSALSIQIKQKSDPRGFLFTLKGKSLFWISGLKSSPSKIGRKTKYIYIPGEIIQGRFV
jgi:hypothetical protein